MLLRRCIIDQSAQCLDKRIIFIRCNAIGRKQDTGCIGFDLALIFLDYSCGIADRRCAGGNRFDNNGIAPTVKLPSTFAPAPIMTPRSRVG